jgi:hypothetical protein
MTGYEQKVMDRADRACRIAMQNDPISMTYAEIKVSTTVDVLDGLRQIATDAVVRRNEAEMLMLELLHILASQNPHAELVEQKLAEDTTAFEKASQFLGVDIPITGTLGGSYG